MLSLKEQAIQLVHTLESQYFKQRDMDAVLALVDENVTWIGTGVDEICHGRDEARRFLNAEKQTFPDEIAVSNSWYEATDLDAGSCMVYGGLDINGNISVMKQQLRMSFIFTQTECGIKIKHIHLSAPDDHQDRGESYPTKMGYISNQKLRSLLEKQSKELEKRGRDLEALMGNIPGGVQCCRNDGKLTILNCNDGFVNMFGYTPEELEEHFQNQYFQMIYPEDRRRVNDIITGQLEKGNVIEVEYRVLCKDGSIMWVLDKGQLIADEDGILNFYCVLVDITFEKQAQEELRMSLERYQIVSDQTTDIIFEWDVIHDTLMLSSNWYKKFGYEAIDKHISKDILKSKNVYRDDVQTFARIIEEIMHGKRYSEGEIRLRKIDGNYLWCRVRATGQFDSAGRAVRSVGVITDIDSEKRYSQKLVERAERDGLTGIYNKASAESYMQEFLQGDGRDGHHALLMIDVDNFKRINDSRGHLFGDAYLSEGAGALKKLFRDSDIVGRIGGDEFIVLMKNIQDQERIVSKANAILEAFAAIIPEEEAGREVTVSIGISQFPQDAKDYTQLYQKADRALYQVKRGGKKSHAFYEEKMDSVDASLQKEPGRDSGGIDSDEMLTPVNNQLIEYILQTLYQSSDIETAINLILAIVGRYYDVSRAYIFESSENDEFCFNTFEWCNDGVQPEKKNLQNLSYKEDLGDYISNFNSDGVFYCRDISVLHPDLYDILAPQGIKSVLQCAIMDNGKFKGMVGFDECRSNRLWVQEQIDTLTIVSSVLGIFLMKARAQSRLEQMFDQTKEILDSQSAWLYVVSEESFELQFLNQKVKEVVPGAECGITCHKAFFGRETPCRDCPVSAAKKAGKTKKLEIMNHRLDVWIEAEAVPIKWAGKEKHWLLCCHDITNYKINAEKTEKQP